VEPGPVEPGRVEPGRMEPGRVEPGRMEPGPVESGRVEPGRVEPGPGAPLSGKPRTGRASLHVADTGASEGTREQAPAVAPTEHGSGVPGDVPPASAVPSGARGKGRHPGSDANSSDEEDPFPVGPRTAPVRPAVATHVGAPPLVPMSLDTIRKRLEQLLSTADLQGWPTYVVAQAYSRRFGSSLRSDIGGRGRVKHVLASVANVRCMPRRHWVFFSVGNGPSRDLGRRGVAGDVLKPSEYCAKDWHRRLFELVAAYSRQGLSTRDMEEVYWRKYVWWCAPWARVPPANDCPELPTGCRIGCALLGVVVLSSLPASPDLSHAVRPQAWNLSVLRHSLPPGQ
jgi:hypothetical protein